MCGIAGIYLKKKEAASAEGMERFANELLLGIERRGRHATGFVAVSADGREIKLDKAAEPASEFIKNREKFPDDVQTVLLHTRWATKGPQEVLGNNHPVTSGTCFAIHNGHIHNDDELFEEEKLPRAFEVDSEVIPALLSKVTLKDAETIKEALEKFRGDMAIAAIDPIKFPQRLLLAKGMGSPLYIFENKNVVVWASDPDYIREAWGNQVGTPPSKEKIYQAKLGEFFIADKLGNLQMYKFTPKSRYASTGWNSDDWEDWGRRPTTSYVSRNRNRNGIRVTDPNGRHIIRPWDSTGAFNTRGQFDAALRAYVNDKTVVPRKARTWVDRAEDLIPDEALSDIEDGVVAWYNCPTCQRAVLRQDVRNHLKYGPLCLDCLNVCYDAWMNGNNATKRNKDEEKDEAISTRMPQLQPRDRSNLENWAIHEAKFHRYTLEELSDQTGFSAHTLDFLIFRTGVMVADFGHNVVSLKNFLTRLYESVDKETREVLGSDVMREVASDSTLSVFKAQEYADEHMYPWKAFSESVLGRKTSQVRYECEEHGEKFNHDEICFGCQQVDEESLDHSEERNTIESCGVQVFEVEETSSETKGSGENARYNLIRCADCDNWMYRESNCIFCGTGQATVDSTDAVETARRIVDREPIAALNPGPERVDHIAGGLPANLPKVPEIPGKCSGKHKKNRACRAKVKYAKDINGKLVSFCARHWKECSLPSCSEKALFTSTDGNRFCHKDSRRKPGEADSLAGTNARIMEVV